MNYFKVLGLVKEPFSNSPDPEFFFQSRRHVSCLQKLEISVRMRRGLNVVMGEVGTGKTTLSRLLIRKFSEDEKIETYLILDPDFKSPIECLSALIELFGLPAAGSDSSEWKLKDNIQKYLFRKGVEEQKIVVLIVDEGQKIAAFFVEILRELLNFEVNEYKLLQIVIFAQKEFQQVLSAYPNFTDRINLVHHLGPLDFSETRSMIRFRLNQAKEAYKIPDLFSLPGYFAAYRATGGYPRKIIHLCHRAMLTMIIQNRKKAGWRLVNWCARMTFPGRSAKWRWAAASGAIVLIAVVLLRFGPGNIVLSVIPGVPKPQTTAFQEEPQSAGASMHGTEAPIPAVKKPPAPEDQSADDRGGVPASGTRLESESAPPVLESEVFATASTPLPETPVSTSEGPPAILGSITVIHGQTLNQLLQSVYGSHDARLQKAVVQANPDLKNINKLLINQTITFPVPGKVVPAGKGILIKVAVAATLQEGYDLLKAYPRDTSSLKLVPYWNSREGLRFGIFLDGCCRDEQAAAAAMKGLPPQFSSGSIIVAEREKDTFFYGKF
jgi:general secretion pathway protein A